MVDVTLLEVNLEGSQFTAHAPFSGEDSDGGKVSRLLGTSSSAEDDDAASDEIAGDEGDSDGAPRPIAGLVALALVVVLAVLVRKLLGGPDREPPEELDVETDDPA